MSDYGPEKDLDGILRSRVATSHGSHPNLLSGGVVENDKVARPSTPIYLGLGASFATIECQFIIFWH